MINNTLYPSSELCIEFRDLWYLHNTEKVYIVTFNKNREIFWENEYVLVNRKDLSNYKYEDYFNCPSVWEMVSLLPKKLHILDMEWIQDWIYFFMLYCIWTKYIASYQWKNWEDVFDYARKEEWTLPDSLLKLCIWINKYKNAISPIYFYPII